jgi:hypothetical protein
LGWVKKSSRIETVLKKQTYSKRKRFEDFYFVFLQCAVTKSIRFGKKEFGKFERTNLSHRQNRSCNDCKIINEHHEPYFGAKLYLGVSPDSPYRLLPRGLLLKKTDHHNT